MMTDAALTRRDALGQRRLLRWLSMLLLPAMLLLASSLLAPAAHAQPQGDPPTRVARLGYMAGQVSFAPAGEDEWVDASLNRPLTNGDRLWVDNAGRVELDLGNAAVRLDGLTAANVLNVDERVAQFQLTQGTVNVSVRNLLDGEFVEIDTPNLAVTLREPGSYRISVDANGNATSVGVRAGQAEVMGEGAAYLVNPGQSYRFAGTDLRAYQLTALAVDTDFDRWSLEREQALARSTSARYVSTEVIGYRDLDTYGTWRDEPEYGPVWVPTRVVTGWAPYHDGHWAWVQPWGWTWIDAAPWGFAPFHYGRWVHVRGGWCWVPGPKRDRPLYAPALVAFIGGPGWQAGPRGPGVAWFPLGPRDVYRPGYHVSRGYFTRINVSNTSIAANQVSSHYDNPRGDGNYMNRRVPGAVIAVPTSAFGQGRSMSRAAMQVPPEALARAPVNHWAEVVPTRTAVTGGAPAGHHPPEYARQRPVFARTPPPAPALGFAAQQGQLANRGGRPLDAGERAQLQGGRGAPAAAGLPPVRLVAPTAAPSTPPAQPPQPAGPANAQGGNRHDANDNEHRGRRDEFGDRGNPGRRPVGVPTAPPQPQAPQQVGPQPPVQQAQPANAQPQAQPLPQPQPQPRADNEAVRARMGRPTEPARPADGAAPAFGERRGLERRERPEHAQPQAQPAPQPQAQPQPQPQPRAEPAPQPRARPEGPRQEAPRQEPPRAEQPRPQPQPQPAPRPQAQPQPQPQAQPQPQPQQRTEPAQAHTRSPGAERKAEEERKREREDKR